MSIYQTSVSMTWAQYQRRQCTMRSTVRLSEKEAALLALLMIRRGEIVPAGDVTDFLYGEEPDGGALTAKRMAEVALRYLRMKIPGLPVVRHRTRGLELVR